MENLVNKFEEKGEEMGEETSMADLRLEDALNTEELEGSESEALQPQEVGEGTGDRGCLRRHWRPEKIPRDPRHRETRLILEHRE